MKTRFFTEKQIYTATFFGGPIPPGILIYRNLKRINEDRKATLALILTALFTILIFLILFNLPEELTSRIPNIAFTALYTLLVFLALRTKFSEAIELERFANDDKASNWNVAGLTLLGLLINIFLIVAISSTAPAFPGDRFEYGDMKHEIYYDEGELSRQELLKIGHELSVVGYFTGENRMSVRIALEDSNYVLTIPIQKSFWKDQVIIDSLISLKSSLMVELGRGVIIELAHYDLSGEHNMEI